MTKEVRVRQEIRALLNRAIDEGRILGPIQLRIALGRISKVRQNNKNSNQEGSNFETVTREAMPGIAAVSKG